MFSVQRSPALPGEESETCTPAHDGCAYLHGCALLCVVSWGADHSEAILCAAPTGGEKWGKSRVSR